MVTGVRALAVGLLLLLTASSGSAHVGSDRASATAATPLPHYDHVVVVVFENHNYSTIKDEAPYFMKLADKGAEMTHAFAVTHPSQPNYLSLFAGDTFGKRDECPFRLTGRQLASQLRSHGYTFKAYSESLPETGFLDCSGGGGLYKRRHAPWVSFSSFPQALHKPFSAFPHRYSKLPDVSFVVPNMCNDMHNCSVATGDDWLRENLAGYATWARSHNSLLIVTFDEDEDTPVNHIYTAIVGAHIDPGNYRQRINHFNVLRTIEDLFGLPALRNAKDHRRIAGIWN